MIRPISRLDEKILVVKSMTEFNEQELAELLADYIALQAQATTTKSSLDEIKNAFLDIPLEVVERNKNYTILHDGHCFVFSIFESIRNTIDTKAVEAKFKELGINMGTVKKQSDVIKFTATESTLFNQL